MTRTQLSGPGTIAHVPFAPGGAVEIRPARMDDEGRVRDFVVGLSPRTQTFRFFCGVPRPGASLLRAMLARDDRRDALLAVRPATTGGEVVGHAMSSHATSCHPGSCHPGSEARNRGADAPAACVAEIAVVVADAWQGRGIGRRLVELLVLRAAARGATEIGMDVLGENRRVLRTIRRRWPDAVMRASSGTVEVRARITGSGRTFAE